MQLFFGQGVVNALVRKEMLLFRPAFIWIAKKVLDFFLDGLGEKIALYGRHPFRRLRWNYVYADNPPSRRRAINGNLRRCQTAFWVDIVFRNVPVTTNLVHNPKIISDWLHGDW